MGDIIAVNLKNSEIVQTLSQIIGEPTLRSKLPNIFFSIEFLEVKLWQWVGLFGTIFFAYFLSWIAARFMVKVGAGFARRTMTDVDDLLIERLTAPVRLLAAIFIYYIGLHVIGLGGPGNIFFVGMARACIIIVTVWILVRITDLISDVVGKRLALAGRNGAYSLLPIGRKTAKAVLSGLAALALLQNFGVNVTALLAGLGVGGLAVALASQKTLENLFGGIMISLDQPVRVGDTCRFGDKVGTVEDIGLRSVRVRTLDRTVVAIPNAEFSQMQLENFGLRDRIRFQTVLGLRYETSPDQMRAILLELRRLLLAHAKIDTTNLNVRFIAFNSSSLDIEIVTYVLTTEYAEFLAVREDILLRIMDIVAACGSGFAFPSRTNYFISDSGLDNQQKKATEERIKALRARGELWMGDFPESEKLALQGTIPYPSESR